MKSKDVWNWAISVEVKNLILAGIIRAILLKPRHIHPDFEALAGCEKNIVFGHLVLANERPVHLDETGVETI